MEDIIWYILDANTGEVVVAEPGDILPPQVCEQLAALLAAGELDVISSGEEIDLDALVSPEHGCPDCGERRMDWLVWHDDEFVKCLSCGCEYEP